MSDQQPAPEECANCGARIPRGARSCPECGADERTGWRESSVYDGIDLPDTEESEPRRPHSARVNRIAWYWWLAGAVVLAALILGGLGLG